MRLAGWLGGWLAEAQRASKDTGAQLSGVVCFFCLAISGLEEHWGSSCRVLSGPFVLKFRASGLQLSGIVCFFASGNFGPLGIQLWVCCLVLS